MRDRERNERIQKALSQAECDAVICTLPGNVLLLSGYWPVVGNALAVARRDGLIAVLAPEDERELAQRGRADRLCTFKAASLDELRPLPEVVRGPLARLLSDLDLGPRSTLGYEAQAQTDPAPYAAMNVYGPELRPLLQDASHGATLLSASDLLARLRAALTPPEVDRVRAACTLAGRAFAQGRAALRPGQTEYDVAAAFTAPLSTLAADQPGGARPGGLAFCMSGERSADAYRAYQLTSGRHLRPGDLVLVHCNSCLDGYFTDVTRTFCLGDPPERSRALYEAVLAARRAALAAVRPGVRGKEVDRAARAAIEARGFGPQFRHAAGHGVGLAAIDHNARPRIHPLSDDVLAPGMTFNLEPAIYLAGHGGVRHCDVVSVTDGGAEVLTPFLAEAADLIIR